MGWGAPSEWSEEVELLELRDLEIERLWSQGLSLPVEVTHRILSFLKYDSFKGGRGAHSRAMIHRSTGRLVTLEELKLKCYRMFFSKLRAIYDESGGGAASLEVRDAREKAMTAERALAAAFAAKQQSDRAAATKQAAKDRGMLLLSASAPAMSLPQLTGGNNSGSRHLSRSAGLWSTVLGLQFFRAGGQWVGFAMPPLGARIGDTMFIRTNTDKSNEHAVQCGRSPLLLGHDDEQWAPVTLQVERLCRSVKVQAVGVGVGVGVCVYLWAGELMGG